MSNPTRIPAPNYTQVPNAIFDLMADKAAGLTEKELKVLLAIARKTFGWHKKRDKISLTQLERLTSLSRPSVVAGLDSAIARGIVQRTPDTGDKRGGVFYELVVADDDDQSIDLTSKDFELVQNLNQSNIITRTSKDFELDLVKNINTQKKGKETKERVGGMPAHTHPAMQILAEHFPDVTLDAKQIKNVCSTATNEPVWRTVVALFANNNWRPLIGNMLERYQKALAERTKNGATDRVAPTAHLAPRSAPPDTKPPQEVAARMQALIAQSRGKNDAT